MVIGSTLIVEPFRTLPGLALRRGIPTVMVNLGSATRYDDAVDLLVRDSAGSFFSRVAEQLDAMNTVEEKEIVEGVPVEQFEFPSTCAHVAVRKTAAFSVLDVRWHAKAVL